MIRLVKNRIKWDRGDVRLMSQIIGTENASSRQAPPLSSIVKLAARKGAELDERARAELDVILKFKRVCKAWKNGVDAKINDPLAAEYFAHQRADLWYIYKTNLRAYLLAHEPGVGKTLVAIRYAEFRKAKRILVVTPMAAKEQWRDEIRRWRDRKRKVRIVDGTIGEQETLIKSVTKGWVITHWESLVHARAALLDGKWDLVILDEGHHIQSRHAQRTDTALALSRRARARMVLTAHPYSNAVKELFPILKFLYPKIYPAFWRWAHIHIQIDPGPFGGYDLSTPRRPNLLKWEMEHFTLRRKKKDVWQNLPAIARVRRVVTLSARGRREYQKLQKQFFVELEAHKGEKNILAIPSVLARITRLRQYLIDPGLLGAKEKSAKYTEILNILGDVETPSVIFTSYRQAALRLQSFLKKHKLKVDVLAGGMKHKANSLKKKFLRGELDALIVLTSVGGTALNLGKYGYVIHLDLPWNPKDFEQTEGRVDRPEEGTGKMVPTTSYRVVVKDSYEERMEQKLRDKHVDFTKVFTVKDAMDIFGERKVV